jgi:hypothetical protein
VYLNDGGRITLVKSVYAMFIHSYQGKG